VITLSGIPDNTKGPFRIYYKYRYSDVPTGYTMAPKFVSSQLLDSLDKSFITEDEVLNFIPYANALANVDLGNHSIKAISTIYNTTYAETGEELVGTRY
jgi:hypothetical protein